jgi:hypothetical protein
LDNCLRSPCKVWNPTFTRFTCATGATEYFLDHKASGVGLTWGKGISREAEDTRGGLLCDEPGMGKTITVLALILKTRRPLPYLSSGQMGDELSVLCVCVRARVCVRVCVCVCVCVCVMGDEQSEYARDGEASSQKYST